MMNLRIEKIEDVGDAQKERVVFTSLADQQVGRYLVLKTKKVVDGVSSKISLTFWFPDKEIKKGDLVILYSKLGLDKSTVNASGNTSHFFYWNQSSSVWGPEEAVVLVSSEGWDFKFTTSK